MKAKDRKYIFDISGFGKRNKYKARTLNNAVFQFRREFQLLLKTDPETGGWEGISYDVIERTN